MRVVDSDQTRRPTDDFVSFDPLDSDRGTRIDDMSVGDDNNILSAAVCKKAGSETLLKSGVIDDPTRCGPNLRNRFTRLQSQGWVCHNFAERHIAKVEIEDLCATATSRSERTRQWNGYHYEARRPDRRFRGRMVTS